MQIAPEITFEGSESSDAARAQILREIKRLETHPITDCRVKVIAPTVMESVIGANAPRARPVRLLSWCKAR
jgi:hypothetical protein